MMENFLISLISDENMEMRISYLMTISLILMVGSDEENAFSLDVNASIALFMPSRPLP